MRKLLVIGTFGLAACSVGATSHDAQPSGQQGQRAFEVGAFQKVALQGPHNVVVTVGGASSVRAEGDTAALEMLDIRVEGNRLVVGTQRNWSWRGPRGAATIHVTMPAIDEASIGGSGDMRIDRVQAQGFEASIGGSGSMQIAALQAREAEFSIAGSGSIRAAGQAEAAEISIAGSGEAALGDVQARRAQVTIMGSGDISIQASETVDGSIMGSGDVNVRGPARCSVRRMGSGSVNCGSGANSGSSGETAD